MTKNELYTMAWNICNNSSCQVCQCLDLCIEKDNEGQKGSAMDIWAKTMISKGQMK